MDAKINLQAGSRKKSSGPFFELFFLEDEKSRLIHDLESASNILSSLEDPGAITEGPFIPGSSLKGFLREVAAQYRRRFDSPAKLLSSSFEYSPSRQLHADVVWGAIEPDDLQFCSGSRNLLYPVAADFVCSIDPLQHCLRVAICDDGSFDLIRVTFPSLYNYTDILFCKNITSAIKYLKERIQQWINECISRQRYVNSQIYQYFKRNRIPRFLQLATILLRPWHLFHGTHPPEVGIFRFFFVSLNLREDVLFCFT